jgi:hypothetical protein
MEKRLDAVDPDYVPEEGCCKPPPKSIAITKSKENNATPDCVITGKVSFPIYGDDKNHHCNSWNAITGCHLFSKDWRDWYIWHESLSSSFIVNVISSLITWIFATQIHVLCEVMYYLNSYNH